MRFLLVCLMLLTSAASLAQSLPVVPVPVVAAKSWLLMEFGSGQILASQNAEMRQEPASLTKLMTAYLTFSALRQGNIALDKSVPISEQAWRTAGSKMFVRVGTQVRVEDLIKGMIVQSGNDACIALSEAIAGSEESFVQMMNQEAQRLGMKATHFSNATGLPDVQHYSTARDLALLATALIRDFPEEYATYYALKEFRYNNITQPNRNRLLWLDPNVDGVKTGHTEAAGYCLIASAHRGPRRLLSVVLGAETDSLRAQESLKLLNHGFQFYETVPLYAKNQVVSQLKVWKGGSSTVKAGFNRDVMLSVPRGYASKVRVDLVSQQPLIAPVIQGQKVGQLKVVLDGKVYAEFPVMAIETVAQAGIIGRAIDSMRLWFN